MKNRVIRDIILVTLLGITYYKFWSKFQYCKDDDSKAHAWDYCTLTNGNNIPQCVGYC